MCILPNFFSVLFINLSIFGSGVFNFVVVVIDFTSMFAVIINMNVFDPNVRYLSGPSIAQ